MLSEFERYAVETLGKPWEDISSKGKLRLRKLFDKKNSSGIHRFIVSFNTIYNYYRTDSIIETSV